jgi:hypothetical protein
VVFGRYVGDLFCGEPTRENKARVLGLERERERWYRLSLDVLVNVFVDNEG